MQRVGINEYFLKAQRRSTYFNVALAALFSIALSVGAVYLIHVTPKNRILGSMIESIAFEANIGNRFAIKRTCESLRSEDSIDQCVVEYGEVRIQSGASEGALPGDRMLQVSPEVSIVGAFPEVEIRVSRRQELLSGQTIVFALGEKISWYGVLLPIAAIVLLTFLMGLVTRYLYFGTGRKIVQEIRSLESGIRDRGEQDQSLAFNELQAVLSSHKNLTRRVVEAEVAEQKRRGEAAIASMTKMVAHDVRKPFSSLNAVIQLLSGVKTIGEFRRQSEHLIREVNSSLTSVNGLLSDLLSIGVEKPSLVLEKIAFEELVRQSLVRLASEFPESDVRIDFSSPTLPLLSIDQEKVSRVFSNILSNALQAMPASGRVVITGKDREGFVEVAILNTGSWIPDKSLDCLFDAFFTSDKKGGTGLGLAIAKQWVEAHEGKIWCDSGCTETHPDGYCQFTFTLPCSSDGSASYATAVSTSLRAFASDFSVENEPEESLAATEVVLRESLDSELAQLSARLKMQKELDVLILDDESLYSNALKSQIEALFDDPLFRVRESSSFEEAVSFCKNSPPDLVFCDFDLGDDGTTGLQFASALREFEGNAERHQAFLCLHSNRAGESVEKDALQSGFDAVVSKPISNHLLTKILLRASMRRTPCERLAPSPEKALQRVIVVEDSSVFRMAWKTTLSEHYRIKCFRDASSFLDWVSDEELSDCSLLVTDLHLGEKDLNGVDVAARAKVLRPSLPTVLATCADDIDSPDGNVHFDEVWDKETALSLQHVSEYLNKKASSGGCRL